MHNNTAVGCQDAEDTHDQPLRVDSECDSVPNGKVVRNSKNRTARLEKHVNKHVHRCSETHDRTGACTILVSVPSVSPCANSETYPEQLNVACWNVNKSVAHEDCEILGSVHAQVILLQETTDIKHDGD